MHLSELLKASWTIYRRNKIILYLAAMGAAVQVFNAFDPIVKQEVGFLLCGYQLVSLLVLFANFFSEVGFIQTVYAHQMGRTSTFKDIWDIFRSRFGPLFLISLFFTGSFIVLFFFLLLIIFLITYGQPKDLNNTLILVSQVILVILSPFLIIIGYAFRSTIVERSGTLPSIARGFQVLRKNLGITLLIFVINTALFHLLQGVASFLYFAIVQPSRIELLINPVSLSYAELISTPAATVIRILFSLVISPLYSICITLIYLRTTPKEFPTDVRVQPAVS